jgi:hypothetical protein
VPDVVEVVCPEKNVWKQVYSELYVKLNVFSVNAMKVDGDVGYSSTHSY